MQIITTGMLNILQSVFSSINQSASVNCGKITANPECCAVRLVLCLRHRDHISKTFRFQRADQFRTKIITVTKRLKIESRVL